MHWKTYIRVVSDEVTIRALHRETSGLGVVEQLRARRDASDENWWQWRTPQIEIDEFANIDRQVRALLEKYRPFFAAIKQCSDTNSDVYLELVSYYEEGERASGLYLSTEVLRLLGELGAALDNDVVDVLRPET